jgi:tryptophan synthase beta chain
MVSIQDIKTATIQPDSLGRFGRFGGKYVPAKLIA